MLFLLRNIRRKLMSENKVTTYLLYAVGEIVLVVVGILIAVSIDNWNTEKSNRQKEIQYLKNIRLDLQKDLLSLDTLSRFRNDKAVRCRLLIEYMDGKSIHDLTEVTFAISTSIWEQHFIPNNTTFTELANSGNLSLISNDSIKEVLLELESLYDLNKAEIDHETFDYREYISKPISKHIRLDRFTHSFMTQTTATDAGITLQEVEQLLQDLQYRNGLHITSFMSDYCVLQYELIESMTSRLIALIDLELERNE